MLACHERGWAVLSVGFLLVELYAMWTIKPWSMIKLSGTMEMHASTIDDQQEMLGAKYNSILFLVSKIKAYIFVYMYFTLL